MSTTEPGPLSQDEVYDLLSNPRRRFIISYLREHDHARLQDLASTLAAWENETSVDQLTNQQRKRVYVSLYQTHIPKLVDAGIITYDQDSGQVAIESRIEQLDRYIPHRDRATIDWRRAYLAIVIVGGVTYALVAFDVSVFAAVSDVLAGALILVAILAVAAMQYLSERDGTGKLAPRRGRDRQQ